MQFKIKFIFDRVVALIGLLLLWPVLLVVAIMVKVKMPGGPVFLSSSVWAREGDCSRATSSVV